MDAFAEERVQICAGYMKKTSPLLQLLHDSTDVTQLNSVPRGSRCAVTQQELHNGIQIITDKIHVCLHENIAQQWFHYFRIRHFPEYLCGVMRQWIKAQPWFAFQEHIDATTFINSHWIHTAEKMYQESKRILTLHI